MEKKRKKKTVSTNLSLLFPLSFPFFYHFAYQNNPLSSIGNERVSNMNE